MPSPHSDANIAQLNNDSSKSSILSISSSAGLFNVHPANCRVLLADISGPNLTPVIKTPFPARAEDSITSSGRLCNCAEQTGGSG